MIECIVLGGIISFLCGFNSRNIFFSLSLISSVITLIILYFSNYVQCDDIITILSISLDIALHIIGLIINLKLDKD